jgi:hypothetical protein
MSGQVIHDKLIVTLGREVVAHSTVTNHLRTAQFDPTKFLHTPKQVHLTSMTPAGPSWQPLKKSRFHQCTSLREPPISRPVPFPED